MTGFNEIDGKSKVDGFGVEGAGIGPEGHVLPAGGAGVGDDLFAIHKVVGAVDELDGLESGMNFPLSSASRVITARGTERGLVFRIDGKVDWDAIVREVMVFVAGRKTFLEGGIVSIEWIDVMPEKDKCLELEALLKREFSITVPHRERSVAVLDQSRRKRKEKSARLEVDDGLFAVDDALDGDFGGDGFPAFAGDESARLSDAISIDRISDSGMGEHGMASGSRSGSGASVHSSQSRNFTEQHLSDRHFSGHQLASQNTAGDSRASVRAAATDVDYGYVSRVAKMLGEDVLYEDEANAKIVFGTLRSGQRVETPFSLIVVGDVNPGADLVAGGDIVVLGCLRGTAHASAYDDDSLDRVIVALQMQPMQLRIGTIISRGGEECASVPEIAHIEDRRVVVETYNSRLMQKRKLGF